jgi:serine/threonine-protein kinase ATR
LTELQSVDDPASAPAPSFNVALPSSTSIGEFWPESQQIIALPHDLQRTITSQLGAIHVGFCLLLSLVNVIQLQGSVSVTPGALDHHLPWIMDSAQALWKHFRRWTTSSEKRLFVDEITRVYLQLLEIRFLPALAPEYRSSASLKNAQALIVSLSELLNGLSSSPASEISQVRLAILFTHLRSILISSPTDVSTTRRRQDASRSIVLHDVEEVVASACQDVEQFSKLHKDLQVCTEHCNVRPR